MNNCSRIFERALLAVAMFFLFSGTSAFAQTRIAAPSMAGELAAKGTISTVAGGGPTGIMNPSLVGIDPVSVAADPLSSSYYVADTVNQRVWKVDPLTTIRTITGNGGAGYSGDGGPAANAQVSYLTGIATDSLGNLYIADTGNDRIRKVDTAGKITTIAGTGVQGYTGDGGPAVSAQLSNPRWVAVGASGNIYFSDQYPLRIRRIAPNGIITTVAGNGTSGDTGDGGPAVSASFQDISGLSTDVAGNLYIVDGNSRRVRKVTVASGIIATVAGNGTSGFSGDGGPATSAQLNFPQGVAIDSEGAMYISDNGNARIRKVLGGTITTVAGTGSTTCSPNGSALSACILPTALVAKGTTVVFAEKRRLRQLLGGSVFAIAGNGSVAYSGDGVPATSTQLAYPNDVAFDSLGNMYIADEGNDRVRKVTPSGTILMFAGNGTSGRSGDGGPATNAQIDAPSAIAVDRNDNVYISTYDSTIYQGIVRKVSADGTISTFAGGGAPGQLGDGGPATSATLSTVWGLAVDHVGNVFIADFLNYRVRKVDLSGTIFTVAGNGTYGFSGDGGPATAAQLSYPIGIDVDATGAVLIVDGNNNRIRRVDATGKITSVAGNGSYGFAGDGGPAINASFASITDIAIDPAGSIFVADSGNYRVRMINPAGIVTTVGGTGTSGFTGDGGPATSAKMSGPTYLGLDAAGHLYFSDKDWILLGAEGNSRIRRIEGIGKPKAGSKYHALSPTRILDSRTGTGSWNGPLQAGLSRDLQVTGLGGASNVPSNATAVAMNITVTDATQGSFVAVWPSGAPQPNSSNLNFGVGETIPNLVTVKLGAGGKVSFANAHGEVNVIVDVVGYYDDGSGAGDLFNGVTPTRLLDSRTPTGGWNAKLQAGTARNLTVTQPGNPSGVPATATAVIANVTVTGGTAGSFVSVWPTGLAQPNVSNLNFGPGQTIPNLVIVKIGTGGAIRFANAIGGVDVIVDIVGYFDPATGSRFHAINPTRVLDDRVGTGLTGAWGPNQSRALTVAGAAGSNVPTGATGLVANVTATAGTAGSFVTVYPDGVARPNSSNLNFGPGETIPNLVTVKLAANGKIDLYNALGNVDLIADAVGYYAPT